jgi:predicted nuclease of predicted toxin-antitoxin system
MRVLSRAMMIYLDDDSASRQLSTLLRKSGHDVSIPADFGISGAPDSAHLTQAIRTGRVVLTRNARDFSLLHELVLASSGGHPGILLLHFDNDPTRDLTPKGTAIAIAKIENSGIGLSNELHVLNHWR